MNFKKFHLLNTRLIELLTRQENLFIALRPDMSKDDFFCFEREQLQERYPNPQEDDLENDMTINSTISELQKLITPPNFDYTSQIALDIFGTHDPS